MVTISLRDQVLYTTHVAYNTLDDFYFIPVLFRPVLFSCQKSQRFTTLKTPVPPNVLKKKSPAVPGLKIHPQRAAV